MTQKTEDTFNLDSKKVYKYNFIKHPSETVSDYMVILSPLYINGPDLDDTLGNLIDEFYVTKEIIDSKRRKHLIQFTIN